MDVQEPYPEPGDVRLSASEELEVFDGELWIVLRAFPLDEPEGPIRNDPDAHHRPP